MENKELPRETSRDNLRSNLNPRNPSQEPGQNDPRLQGPPDRDFIAEPKFRGEEEAAANLETEILDSEGHRVLLNRPLQPRH